jgi:hypothetical protein
VAAAVVLRQVECVPVVITAKAVEAVHTLEKH